MFYVICKKYMLLSQCHIIKVKWCLDQQLRNRLANLNFDAIFEFTGMIILFKYCDEIPNKSPPLAVPKFANASSCDPFKGVLHLLP